MLDMSQILIHFDDETLKAIDRIAPAAKRKRADFIRQAVKDAIFRNEMERMREAYRLQPDSAEGSEFWDLPEEWNEEKA
jgi:metal-responsive CopG/Arc/MetJ family transcriptional regulator